uniref:RalBP1-associated Eps domain-containing protein 2 n=1 Tax=Bursaphelenchus xylophilus TaxID=6326 RepID=A0A1I7RSD6_BURXY
MSTSNSGDSDDADKASTADESRKWSEDENSDSLTESDEEDISASTTTETDSAEARRRAKLAKRVRQHQSDTETRNLLDDIGDGEDDIIDLEESKGANSLDLRFFDMSDEQLDYYTNCFLYLQRKTQGQATMGGAVSGAEDLVVEFFRKSKLDTHTLSKVWALADVNEDGFLNHSEFVIAMHMIVLHVKGSVPIPSRLPSPVRPCPTPVRHKFYEFHNSTASSTLTTSGGYSQENASTSKALDTSNFQSNEGQKHQHSLSDDHIHSYIQQHEVRVTDFSDAPPVLVDNRPQPLNPTNSKGLALLNALSSKGPPPQPPPRDYHNKGHGRSASLDLKAFGGTSLGVHVIPSLSSSNPQPVGSSDVQSQSHSLYTSSEQPPYPPGSQSGVGGSLPAIHDKKPGFHPPLPPNRPCERKTQETQTDYEEPVSLDSDVMASLLTDMEDLAPKERCELLRKYNTELEAEKATLAQIRLQLQLRIEEAMGVLKHLGLDHSLTHSKCSSSLSQPVKPTAL